MKIVSRFSCVTKTLRQAVLPLGIFVGLAFLLSSCDYLSYNNPFPDSYYSTNFISALGFNEFSGTDTTVPPPDPEAGETVYVTASWDYGYRYIDWDGFEYMTFTAVTTPGQETAGAAVYGTLPAGLASDAPVYRLELVNLITDGAFETGSSGSWSGTGSYSYDSFSRVSGSGSMKVSAESGQSVFYVPQMISGFGSRASLNYSVAFLFLSDEEFLPKLGTAELSSDTEKIQISGSFDPATNGQVLSFSFAPVSVGTSFSGLYVDDFTMKRTGGMSLRLQLKPSETVPPLEGGTYEFSVWVHQDPSALADGTAASYPLNTLTVTMTAAGDATLAVKASSYSPAPGWMKVSAKLSGAALQYPRDEELIESPVLNLVIDLENANPGSILLAAPELRFK